MADEDDPDVTFTLRLEPEELKIVHTAVKALDDDFGHEEADVHAVIRRVLAKLPDEHAMRAIAIPEDGGRPGS